MSVALYASRCPEIKMYFGNPLQPDGGGDGGGGLWISRVTATVSSICLEERFDTNFFRSLRGGISFLASREFRVNSSEKNFIRFARIRVDASFSIPVELYSLESAVFSLKHTRRYRDN